MEQHRSDLQKILDPGDWILSFQERLEAYHHQKEQMAFGAVGLFLAGAVGLIVTGSGIWQTSPPPMLLQLLLPAISSAVAFLFVLWQLRLQQITDIRITACDRLIHKWLTSPPDPIELVVVKRADRLAPKAFLDSLQEVEAERRWKWELKWFWAKWLKARRSAFLLCATILLFAGMTIYRMCI
jgi:hypothetical protein